MFGPMLNLDQVGCALALVAARGAVMASKSSGGVE